MIYYDKFNNKLNIKQNILYFIIEMEKKNKNNSSNLLVFGATGLLGGCFIDNYKKIKKIHVAINKKKVPENEDK